MTFLENEVIYLLRILDYQENITYLVCNQDREYLVLDKLEDLASE